MLNEFVEWFEDEHPQFKSTFGDAMEFYDKEKDEFYIEEVNDAYCEYKSGVPLENTTPMFFAWSKLNGG